MTLRHKILNSPGNPVLEMEIHEDKGIESIFIHNAKVSGLAKFLNPDIPWVWILGHRPNRDIEWREATLPINKLGFSLTAKYRDITYDLMLKTQQFLAAVEEFDDHGITLIQSAREMPDTLLFSRIQENQIDRILVNNGAFLHIHLPHAVETGQVRCFQKGYLAGRMAQLRRL